MNVTMNGRLHYQMIDRDGNVAVDGEQSNLFLDQGVSNLNSAGLSGFIYRVAVGTGSSVPAVTQTGLDSMLAHTRNAFPGYNYNDVNTVRVSPGVYDISKGYEFDFSEANGNLTEWGAYSGGYNSIDNATSRELFRDNNGNPVTLTKTADYKLRLVYTVRFTFGPVVPTPFSCVIDGIGTVTGRYMVNAYETGMFYAILRGYAYRANPLTSARTMDYTAGLTGYELEPGGIVFGNITYNATTKRYERPLSVYFDTSQCNGSMVRLEVAFDYYSCILIVFDQPITKTDQQTLKIDLGKYTWGRA